MWVADMAAYAVHRSDVARWNRSDHACRLACERVYAGTMPQRAATLAPWVAKAIPVRNDRGMDKDEATEADPDSIVLTKDIATAAFELWVTNPTYAPSKFDGATLADHFFMLCEKVAP